MDPVTAYKAYRVARAVPWRSLVAVLLAGLVAVLALAVVLASAVLGTSTNRAAVASTCVQVPAGQTVSDLTAEQTQNAATIIAVAQQNGVTNPHGWVIGIAVALAESELIATLTEEQSDRDSFGLFQQRRLWGPRRETAAGAAEMFYTGGDAGQPGLLDIAGWEQMTVGRAGQAVQRSAFPTGSNYTARETLARAIVAELTGGGTMPLPIGYTDAVNRCTNDQAPAGWEPLPGASVGEAVVNAAARWMGTPYSWGGGTFDGPSLGIGRGAGTVGFDCSGLVLHAWYQGTNGAVRLPHSSATIARITTPVPRDQLQAGDILSFGDGTVTHDGLYDGRGGMIHAPRTGKTVEYVPDILNHPYWGPRLLHTTRPSLPRGEA